MQSNGGWEQSLEVEAQRLLSGGQPEVWDALTRKFESRLIRTALLATHGRRMEAAQRLSPIVTALAEGHWAGIADLPHPADDVTGALVAALADRHGIKLSPRQAEVALMILRGHSTPSIGLRLGLSPQTVKVFRKQLYAKCNLSSQAELFALMVPLLRVG